MNGFYFIQSLQSSSFCNFKIGETSRAIISESCFLFSKYTKIIWVFVKTVMILSAGKDVLRFWDAKVVVFVDYLAKTQTINGQYFANLPR